VHFPWCLKKCPYCDFASAGIKRAEVPHEAYADAVLRELERRADTLRGRELSSVFFGGGTPSLWDPSQLGRVLAGIRAAFGSSEAAPKGAELEVTVECNPTSLDRPRAAALREAGVSRLSIGVQSLDADRLRFLGRLHDAEGAPRAVKDAVAEVPRVSADLMFGMPGQRADEFAAEVEQVLATGARHVSAYALTVEPDTQFGALHRKGRLTLAPEDDYAETFVRAEAVFAAHGMAHYEVSNYASAGEESVHNRHYWRSGDYLGLGAGAVGALSVGANARRTKNDPRPERYLAHSGSADVEVFAEELGPDDRVREALMLGLRTADGMDLAAVRARTGLDPLVGRERSLERRLSTGDVEVTDGHLRVPPARWLHLDAIVSDLF
jgi:oxygen-independent coproporphyrinogen-3 oxidase